MPAHFATIKRIEGPTIATTSGNKAKTFKIHDISDDKDVTLHVEVADADANSAMAWKTSLEAISPGYDLTDWP